MKRIFTIGIATAAIFAAGLLHGDVSDPGPYEDFIAAHNGAVSAVSGFLDAMESGESLFVEAREGLQGACDAIFEVRQKHPTMAPPLGRYLVETEMALRAFMMFITARRAGDANFISDTFTASMRWSLDIGERRLDAAAAWMVEAQREGMWRHHSRCGIR